MGAEEFWSSTPRELEWAFDAAAERMRRDEERVIASGWWSAAFQRSKTLKPLKSILDRLWIGQPQTVDQQARALETIAAMYGLKLKKTRRGA